MAHRFFVDPEILRAEVTVIRGGDARHIVRSLRLTPGDEVTLSDGQGFEAASIILSTAADEVRLRPGEPRPGPRLPAELVLLQGVGKGSKVDFVVEKATELGADRIIAFTARRSVARPGDAAVQSRLGRWRRVAAEAAKQSQRSSIPQVDFAATLTEALGIADPLDRILVLWEREASRLPQLAAPAARVGVAVGPEGGFEDEEVAHLRQRGGEVVTLGPFILRTETAAVAGLAVASHLLRHPPSGPE